MYGKSAAIYDEFYHFIDYKAGAERVRNFIRSRRPGARSLLDVACGTGKHLAELRRDFEVAGVDINAQLLEKAAEHCPGVNFYRADMVEMDLGREFDIVMCLFSSIALVRTLDRMKRAVVRMAEHVSTGGLLMVEPFFGPDDFWTGRVTAHHFDEPELKVTWMYTARREGSIGELENHFLVGRPNGIEHFSEIHEVGLFTEED
jgi:ubiquinone/menaquinone biosynthesis C-methylase UbiE